MNLLKTTAPIIICALVLVGCASSGKQFDTRKVNEIQKGKTTEADLFAMFGQPMARGQTGSGFKTFTWVYSEARTKGETFIPFAGPFIGGVDTRTKTLMVTVGTDGTVNDYNFSGSEFGVAGGVQDDPEKATSTAAKPAKPTK